MIKLKKTINYAKAWLNIFKRKIFESFGNEHFSKPYGDHSKLLSHINKKNGTFIVGGGNDGFFQDPTYYLERFKNWNGFIVEPTRIKKYCRVNRTKSKIYNVALVSNDFNDKKISIIDCGAMTIVKNSSYSQKDWIRLGEEAQKIKSREILVTARTLDSLIDDYFSNSNKREIDLMTLDIEGYELEALKGLNIDKNQPDFILIEIHDLNIKTLIDNYLEKYYDLIDILDSRDYLYKRVR